MTPDVPPRACTHEHHVPRRFAFGLAAEESCDFFAEKAGGDFGVDMVGLHSADPARFHDLVAREKVATFELEFGDGSATLDLH